MLPEALTSPHSHQSHARRRRLHLLLDKGALYPGLTRHFQRLMVIEPLYAGRRQLEQLQQTKQQLVKVDLLKGRVLNCSDYSEEPTQLDWPQNFIEIACSI